jgi:hypothetical protein
MRGLELIDRPEVGIRAYLTIDNIIMPKWWDQKRSHPTAIGHLKIE